MLKVKFYRHNKLVYMRICVKLRSFFKKSIYYLLICVPILNTKICILYLMVLLLTVLYPLPVKVLFVISERLFSALGFDCPLIFSCKIPAHCFICSNRILYLASLNTCFSLLRHFHHCYLADAVDDEVKALTSENTRSGNIVI